MAARTDAELNAIELRRRAEEELARREGTAPLLQMDVRRLLHELHLHQIELEIVNADLRRMHAETLELLRQAAAISEDRLRTHYPDAHVLLAANRPADAPAKALLDALGMKVDVAASDAKAVELATCIDYELILLDLEMPGMSGLDAARAIRAIYGRERTPILAITAAVSPDDRQRCRAAGVDEQIAIPVTPQQLYSAMQHWLAHGRR